MRGPLSLEQMQNIVHLIVALGVEAEKRGTISPAEKDAIISFTSTATALRQLYDEFRERELK
jgi:hypothetical protein